MELSHTEKAFAETLVLVGGISGPRLIYPLMVRETDPRPLWDVTAALQLAPPQVIQQVHAIAQATVDAMGPQAFTFSEGAMVGPWELLAQRGRDLGGEVWHGRRADGAEGTVRVVPPGSGHDPERTARFVERSNAGLDAPHPSILKIDEADEDFGWLYTATMGLDCAPIAALRASGPLAEPTAIALAQGAAASLQVVHGLGVVHGGLSPLALLVRDQRTYLCDFGVGSALLDGPTHGCSPGGRLPLLLYAAPGLVAGDAAGGLDSRDDLFALGAVLYHLVAGVGPADARAPVDAPWVVAPAVSDGLRTVLSRLLAPRREARYSTAGALLADLARVAAGGLPGPLPEPGGHVVGRRHPTAAPQAVLRPEVFRAVQAPPPAPAPTVVEVRPTLAPTPAALPAASDDGEAEEVAAPRRAIEAPAARQRPRERFADGGRVARRGGGWVLCASTLVAVAAGLAVAHLATQPVGPALVRARLARAAGALAAERPRYGEALREVGAALRESEDDPARAREAIALRAAVCAAAERERLAILPEGTRTPVDVVRRELVRVGELIDRCAGVPVEALLRYDRDRASDTVDRNDWLRHGRALLRAGYPEAAADAFGRVNEHARAALARYAAERLVHLPAGPYRGAQGWATREAVYVGRTEVTRAQYAEFLQALATTKGGHPACSSREPEGYDHTPAEWRGVEDGRLPVTGVSYFDAVAYCGWRGLELADEATLLAAAGGPTGGATPWGEDPPSLAYANAGGVLGGPVAVGSFPGGVGVGAPARDLLGNVAEWTASDGAAAKTFGGHYDTPLAELRAAAGDELPLATRAPTLGFRVVLRPGALEP